MKKIVAFLMLLSFVSICNAEYAYPDNPDARPYIQVSYEGEFQTGTNVSSVEGTTLFYQPVDMEFKKVTLDLVKPISSSISVLTTLGYAQTQIINSETKMVPDGYGDWTVAGSKLNTDGFNFKVGIRYYFPVGY